MNTQTTSKQLKTQAADLLEEAKTIEKIEVAYTRAKETAVTLGNLRDCLVNEGFTPEEAFTLVRTIVEGGMK